MVLFTSQMDYPTLTQWVQIRLQLEKNPLAYVGNGSGIIGIGSYTFGYGSYTNCIAVGGNAMRFDIGGSYNRALGYQAGGDALNSYNFSTAIGAKSTYTGSNQIVLGTPTETTIIKGTLDVSGNASFNGTIYNGSSILKQITNILPFNASSFSVGSSYQNPYATPIHVNMTLVTGSSNVFYNIYVGSTTNPTIFLGNGVLVTQNTFINFIVLPYNYWMITGSPLSIGSLVYYY